MGANQWRDEQEWPLARAQADGRITCRAAAGRTRSTATACWAPPCRRRPRRRIATPTTRRIRCPRAPAAATRGRRRTSGPSRARDDVLVYTSEPLAEDLEVTGPLAATLWIAVERARHRFHRPSSSTCSRTARPGRWPMASCAPGTATGRPRPMLLTPGEPTEITIDLGATSNLFKARAPHPPRGLEQQLPAVRSQPEHRRRVRRGPRGAQGRADDPARRGAPVTADPAGGAATAVRRPAACRRRRRSAVAARLVHRDQRAAGRRHRGARATGRACASRTGGSPRSAP